MPALDLPTLDDVERAASRLGDRVHRTPLLGSRTLGERVGAPVFLKAELLQKTGSFKPRGVFTRLDSLTAEERRRGVISISAGNHAQALAYASAREGIDCLVVMWQGASPLKLAAAQGYGAAVDLLAWTGERQVLALLRPGVGPTTIGPDSDLALLTMAPGFTETGDVGLDVEVVGRVSVGETQSTFSFATDLVTAESPTRDFDAPPFARPAWHDRAGDEQPG